MELKPDERIDDLQINGLKLIQNAKKYCFTSDSVLLANSVAVGSKHKLIDFCTGTGIIAVLLAGKKNAQSVVGVELQSDLADIAKRNVVLNNLQDKVSILNISAQDCISAFPLESFDTAVCNPPYRKLGTGETDSDEGRAICKYEIKLTLSELVSVASRLLKFGGRFYMVHRADRLAEIIYELKKSRLEPKVITVVFPKADKQPDTVIFECIKGGAEGVKLKTLTVYDKNGAYTAEAARLYSKEI